MPVAFRPPPPFFYVTGFLAGLALDAATDLPSLRGTPAAGLGAAAVAIGAALVVASAGLFRRAGTPVEPWKEATRLVTSGPYRVTRNPMYVGFTLLHAGAAVWTGVTGALLTLPLVVAAVDRMAIVPEERRLARLFGDDYAAYTARVRRWL